MKKNKMMRLASSLLVAVLLTSSVISGTFAKYVTEGSATDTARVAKWGVEIVATGDNAFAEAYGASDTVVATDADDATVVTNNYQSIANVIAPGTKGDLGSITITGKPEVDVKVSVVANATLTGWTITGDWNGNGTVDANETDVFYCPLIFKKGATVIDGKNYDSAANLAGALVGLFNKAETVEQANTDLSTEGYDSAITWEWPFETGNDKKDTALGNLSTLPTITFDVTATVTQVD